MLPVLYLSFVNRATGDDYGYAVYTRAAWMETHSLIEVLKGSWRTIVQSYYSFQGTWFSLFLFSLQPEVFSDGAYVIVAFLMLFLWTGSTFYLFAALLRSLFGVDKWSYMLITLIFLIISIEFIPSTRSSIFWYNGCVHYMLPFAMCQTAAAWLIKYAREYRETTFAGILIFMTLLGGSNYQAALLSLIAAAYVVIADWFLKKDRRIFTLLIPMAAQLAGLILSMKAPGNKVRGGGDFGFSFSKALKTIGLSFAYALRDIGVYIEERPLIFAGLLLLFVIFLTIKKTRHFKHPVLLSLMLFCLYSAMQAPAIYAGVSVSGGVPNTNYQVFLLTAAALLFILADVIYVKLTAVWSENRIKKAYRVTVGLSALIFIAMLYFCRSSVKTSASFVSLEYIASGQASDYMEQMELQTRLLEDEGTQDVVVPYINDRQGPLMHMPVTDDPDAFTNYAARGFYGKNSVVAMERPEWIRLYGEKWGVKEAN